MAASSQSVSNSEKPWKGIMGATTVSPDRFMRAEKRSNGAGVNVESLS
jgi:hypothetical protein